LDIALLALLREGTPIQVLDRKIVLPVTSKAAVGAFEEPIPTFVIAIILLALTLLDTVLEMVALLVDTLLAVMMVDKRVPEDILLDETLLVVTVLDTRVPEDILLDETLLAVNVLDVTPPQDNVPLIFPVPSTSKLNPGVRVPIPTRPSLLRLMTFVNDSMLPA
jgi:hypothetical protein